MKLILDTTIIQNKVSFIKLFFYVNRSIEEPTVSPEGSDQHLEPLTSPQQETQHQASSVNHRTSHNHSENAPSPRHGAAPGSIAGAGMLSPPKENSHEEGPADHQSVKEFEFGEGLDDFDDFDINEEDVIQAGVIDESEIVDDPGHDQWPDEFEQFEDEIMNNQDYLPQIPEEEEEPHTFPASVSEAPIEAEHMTSLYTASTITNHPKSKLSLKHKPVRTRVTETDTMTVPPVASVRPVQSEECNERQSLLSDCDIKQNKQPIVLESLLKVSSHCWSLHPFVKVKVY